MATSEKINSSADVLIGFEQAAIKHEFAIISGDSVAANKSHAKIMSAIKYLLGNGDRNLIFKFLEHPSEGVRCWAATYLLPTNENDATRVLTQIAKGKSMRALAAETTLSEWRKGRLKI